MPAAEGDDSHKRGQSHRGEQKVPDRVVHGTCISKVRLRDTFLYDQSLQDKRGRRRLGMRGAGCVPFNCHFDVIVSGA